MYESTQENTVGHVTSSVNRLSLVFARSPMLIEHRPRHLNQHPILPFYNSILLWSVGRRILVFKPLITAKGVKRVFLNSVPLSLRIALMAWDNSFFNLKIKSRTNSKASSLVLMKKTQEYREKSSTITRTYHFHQQTSPEKDRQCPCVATLQGERSSPD